VLIDSTHRPWIILGIVALLLGTGFYLQYFKKLRGFRWKLLLSIAVPLIAAGEQHTATGQRPSRARSQTYHHRDEIELTRNFLRATRDYVTTPAQPTTPENWVEQRIGMAERLLWKKDCKVCHAQTTGEPDTIPVTVKSVIPARWLVHADVDHQAHRMLSCESCHAHIAESKLTSDIDPRNRNLPPLS
jgi:hypothetical protein